MKTPLLRDPDIPPTDEQVKKALGKELYLVYDELMNTVTGDKFGLKSEWNYYKDGKAWLCKVTYKKKTIFWLSVWEKVIKTSFYFTEKTLPGVLALDIADKIKKKFAQAKPIGKLLPLIYDIDRKSQMKDFLKITEYKKNLK